MSEQTSHQTGQSKSSWPTWVVLLGSASAALYGFNNRVVIYHDEIINTYKAGQGIIFDYAQRPLYYLLNHLAVGFFGLDVESLVLLSAILFVATAIALYHTGRTFAGTIPAFLGVATYCTSAIVLEHGIRGMPHMSSALALTLTLCLVLRGETAIDRRRQRRLYLVGGLMAILAFATHTTMAGLLLGLGVWSVGRDLYKWRSERFQSFSWRFFPRVWAVLGMMGGGLVLVVWFDLAQGTQSMVKGLVSGIQWVQKGDAVTHHYGKPWYFYFEVLRNDLGFMAFFGWSVVCALAAGISNVWHREGQPQGEQSLYRQSQTVLLLLFVLSFSNLALLSFVRWKFARVLAGQIPMFALLVAAVTTWAFEHLEARQRQRPWLVGKVAPVLSMVLVLGVGVSTLRSVDQRWESIADRKRHLYTSLYEILRHLPRSERIGHLGGSKHRNRLRRFVLAADREWLDGGDGLSSADELEEWVLTEDIEYLLTQPQKGRADWLPAGGVLQTIRFEHIYNYRGYADLWQVQFLEFDSTLENAFAKLPRRTPIGVFGVSGELPVIESKHLERTIVENNLRVYRLNLNRPVDRQFYYLERNHIEYALVPSPDWMPAYAKDLQLIEEEILRRGGQVLARSNAGNLDFWKLGLAIRETSEP